MTVQKDICFFDKSESRISVIYTCDKYKISILLSDGINAVINNAIIGGEKNCVLFFGPDEIHFGRFAQSGIYAYLDIFIPTTFFDEFISGGEKFDFLSDREKDRKNCIYFEGEHRIAVSKIASEIVELIKNGSNANNIKLFSLILQISVLCDSLYQAEKLKPENRNMPKCVVKTMGYISENYSKKLSVKELASVSDCSVTYLSKIFKQYTGMTVYGYITAIRIANSQMFLKEGKNVTETCFICGFNDCSNFINKFKKITGQTPYNYQKNCKNI